MPRRFPLRVLLFLLIASAADGAVARAAAQCSLASVDRTRAELTRLSALQRAYPKSVSSADVAAASVAYVAEAEACFDQLYGRPSETIDQDGEVFDDGLAYYNLAGRKWGVSNTFGGSGVDNDGPHTAGGTVTYSFMADGVDMTGDSSTSAGANLAITSLPGYASCFQTDIAAAFAAWSAIANIQFVQVADSGHAFNAPGATGDIRIGAHVFDGPSGVLAHTYYPPPNGSSASGDMHFDRTEAWGCSAGAGKIDIGIVALHEIGHALGLAHETRTGRRAVMNPTYNPSVASLLLGDDIDAAISVYGSSAGASDDLVLNFGSGIGLWRLNYGVGWSLLHGAAVDAVTTADLDGNGVDDLVVDFGATGVWRLMNNTTWLQVHGLNPTQMIAADLDGNGLDDIVLAFPGNGLWALMNLTTWRQLHPLSPTAITAGNIDATGGDDLVMTFAGYGVWSFRNNTTWTQIHGLDATLLAAGQINAATGAEDILVGFPGYGLYQFTDAASWLLLNATVPRRLAVGDLDADGRDDVVMDFGPGVGVYALKNDSTWVGLHGLPAAGLALGDLDGNGQDEVIVDFGPGIGVWAWVNGGSWVPIHATSTASAPVVADFN